MKFYTTCHTLEELKAEYKCLAKMYHPDCGGSDEIMAQVNAQYVGGSLDQLFGISSPDATGHLDVALQERERTTEAYAPLLSEAQDDRREAYQQHVASLTERIAALVGDKKRLFRLTMVLAAVLFVVLLAVIALFIHDFKNPDAGWITRSILHRLGLYTAVG